jgi:hypothetical protein
MRIPMELYRHRPWVRGTDRHQEPVLFFLFPVKLNKGGRSIAVFFVLESQGMLQCTD